MMLAGAFRAFILAMLVDMSEQRVPILTPEDAALRVEIAAAVLAVTDDAHEQALLMHIPALESGYRADVVDCRRRGPQGELTAWQILPRSAAERARLCVSLEEDARVAVERVRESLRACWWLPPAERLAVYTRGSCSSSEGRRLSRQRWVR